MGRKDLMLAAPDSATRGIMCSPLALGAEACSFEEVKYVGRYLCQQHVYFLGSGALRWGGPGTRAGKAHSGQT